MILLSDKNVSGRDIFSLFYGPIKRYVAIALLLVRESQYAVEL